MLKIGYSTISCLFLIFKQDTKIYESFIASITKLKEMTTSATVEIFWGFVL